MNRAARRRAAAGERHGAAHGDGDRLRLLQNSTRHIDECYQDATREGEADTVVFVLDLRDRAAREVAKLDPRWGADGPNGLEGILVDYAARDEIPTACLAFRRLRAVEMLRHFAPGAARHLETTSPSAGYCWMCVVASGGTLTAQFRGGVDGDTVVSYAH